MPASAVSARGGVDVGRTQDAGSDRPRSLAGWLGAKLAKAVSRVRTAVTAAVRSVRTSLSRAAGWLRAQAGSPARLAKHVFRIATSLIGEDRGFGFWWLVVTVAIALTVGLLVALLLSPVIGILAALGVGIWMLIRRSRSARARQRASAAPAN